MARLIIKDALKPMFWVSFPTDLSENTLSNSLFKGNLKKLLAMKSQNSNLKVIAAVGGANDAMLASWSAVAGSPSALTTFANNVLAFIQKAGIDGIGE